MNIADKMRQMSPQINKEALQTWLDMIGYVQELERRESFIQQTISTTAVQMGWVRSFKKGRINLLEPLPYGPAAVDVSLETEEVKEDEGE